METKCFKKIISQCFISNKFNINNVSKAIKICYFYHKIKVAKLKKLLIFFFICSLVSCQKKEKPIIAFYYWKTIFKLSEVEKTTLSQNKIKKIYLRYFDVALDANNNEPFPVGIIHFDDTTAGFTIVPVIYIKNEVMLNKAVDVKDLVAKITKLIKQINQKKHISIREIQIDCDWALTSKDKYLQFIDLFKKANTTLLSATIRLHQVKYFDKTKIPNVDKGVLMYYNMGKIAPDSLSSIYEKKIADKYLESLELYPLSLNVALPIYCWGIQIRNNRVIGLKSKISERELLKDTNFVMMKPHFFKAKEGNYKHGSYYKKEDIIKIEAISANDLTQMASDLKDNLKEDPKEIILYDLDEFNLNNYEKDIFAKISTRF